MAEILQKTMLPAAEFEPRGYSMLQSVAILARGLSGKSEPQVKLH
jgi:hypothetical protein